jgi:hypothetical protein
VQLALWASRSFPRLRDAAPFMRAAVATLVRDEPTRALLTQLFLYVLSTAPPDVDVRAIRTILLEVAGPEGQEDVMNAADQLREEGRAEGLEGLRTGIAAALSARAIPLSDFGRARLASCASVATLTRWLTHAVTATSEAEVFAGADAL